MQLVQEQLQGLGELITSILILRLVSLSQQVQVVPQLELLKYFIISSELLAVGPL